MDSDCRRHGYDSTGLYHVPKLQSGPANRPTGQCTERDDDRLDSSSGHVSQSGNFPVAGNMPVSDAAPKRIDSYAFGDMCPDCRAAPGTPHAPGCGQNPARVPRDLWSGISWVCYDCGVDRWGLPGIATWHEGVCDVCGETTTVTEPRDFRHEDLTSPASNLDNITLSDLSEMMGMGPVAKPRHSDASVEDSQQSAAGDETPTHIPLDVQEWVFRQTYDDAMDAARACLNGLWGDDELFDLALSRLRSGYVLYGSDAFTWDAETRRRNVMEEIADAIVYLVTGPVE